RLSRTQRASRQLAAPPWLPHSTAANRTPNRSKIHRRHKGSHALSYDLGAAADVRELVRMESACCGFLDFALDEQVDQLLLTITAPPAARESIEEIFSEFAG